MSGKDGLGNTPGWNKATELPVAEGPGCVISRAMIGKEPGKDFERG